MLISAPAHEAFFQGRKGIAHFYRASGTETNLLVRMRYTGTEMEIFLVA
jgi:hypothetical protein